MTGIYGLPSALELGKVRDFSRVLNPLPYTPYGIGNAMVGFMPRCGECGELRIMYACNNSELEGAISSPILRLIGSYHFHPSFLGGPG